jgi:hypothetical protein
MQVGFLRTWIKRKTDIRKLKMTTFFVEIMTFLKTIQFTSLFIYIYFFKSVALSNLFICFFFLTDRY